MKILLCSVPFAPSVGGIETVSALLAREFHHAGHAVTVLTQTASEQTDREAFPLLRRPKPAALARAVREADVVLHSGISLRLAWPLLLWRKPWVVAHHTWLPREGDGATMAELKRAVLPLARNVAVSDAVAVDLPVPAVVIPNPYDRSVFRPVDGVARSRELAFVGRLVADKGVPVLLQAMALLRSRGRYPQLSIIGSGPDERALREQVHESGLGRQVRFAGRLQGPALARALHAHRAVVVPSVWEEPFGLVALEAQACGCIPVVAASGGLPQAAGPAAVVFRKGDPESLAEGLMTVFGMPPGRQLAHEADVQRHLLRHDPARVAQAYLEELERAHRLARPIVSAA